MAVARSLRQLDPSTSALALLGAELRALRVDRTLSLAALGSLVHVSGALLGKIEKAERRPQPDLVARLDSVLEADGRLGRLAAKILDDGDPVVSLSGIILSPDNAVPVLRSVIDAVRHGDHAMSDSAEPGTLLAHAQAAERVLHGLRSAGRLLLSRSIGEAYQLAGWMSFDDGRPDSAERLLSRSRVWVERAADAELAAYVLGPNAAFVATYGGDPALGVERAYGAIGWGRRSGNHRLTAFAMAIAARAHARLGERELCFEMLGDAETELDRHVPGVLDDGWLSVFDRAALEGHRGSCLLDLRLPDQALAYLAEQDRQASRQFVRNRILWQLDRIDALLDLHEVDQACTELSQIISALLTVSPRVRRRFHVLELRLRALVAMGHLGGSITEVVAQLHALDDSQRGSLVNG